MAHKYKDPYSQKIKSSRYYNQKKEKKYLCDLMSIGADRWYPWPVVWSDYEWDWNKRKGVPLESAYPKRNWRRKRSKYLKTISHRHARRNKKMNVYNSTYHKTFDFWWELD